MKNNSSIDFAVSDLIGFVTIPGDAPKREDPEWVADLSDLLATLGAMDDIRVVVLNADGHPLYLDSADDLGNDAADPASWNLEKPSVVDMLAATPQPVIAGVAGEPDGLAMEAMLACDIRIAAEDSFFGFSHVAKGTIPRHGGTQRLARTVGKAKALELILTGEKIDAREAYRIGLVHKVVPKEKLAQTVTSLARTLAAKGPLALRYAKEAVHGGMDLTLAQGLRLETDLYMLLHTTHDRTEGIRAFQEKRKARFTGK